MRGLSDFHKMVLVILKKKFEKAKPKVISYRDYRHFDGSSFRCALRFELSKISTHSYSSFKNTIRANHAPYMAKTLGKAMMQRRQLETKYRKQLTDINSKRYRKENNFCIKTM